MGTFSLAAPESKTPRNVKVTLGGKALSATLKMEGRRALVTLVADVAVNSGQTLEVTLG